MLLDDDRSVGHPVRARSGAHVVPGLRVRAKRWFDIIGSTIALTILSPLILMVAAAIKLESRGPIFTRETRYGYKSQPIRILKFRSTMAGGAKASCTHSQATLVGRVLRRTSIDGIPQFFNVLHGEMSIVGPRPYANPEHLLEYGAAPLLGDVKPGMTDWVPNTHFRNGMDSIQLRIRDDLHYARNWSPFLDVKIILAALLS